MISWRLSYLETGEFYSASILHFSNRNTEKAFYKNEVDKVESRLSKKCFFLSRWLLYYMTDHFATKEKAKCTLYELMPQWVKNLYHCLKRKMLGE